MEINYTNVYLNCVLVEDWVKKNVLDPCSQMNLLAVVAKLKDIAKENANRQIVEVKG